VNGFFLDANVSTKRCMNPSPNIDITDFSSIISKWHEVDVYIPDKPKGKNHDGADDHISKGCGAQGWLMSLSKVV